MENIPLYYIYIAAGFLLTIIAFLAFNVLGKAEQLNHAKVALGKLKRSFNDLDEQAKLIVKTDLELNKAQEELDKRLNGLESLQTISKNISTTLDENEIFSRLIQSLKTELAFEKKIIFTLNNEKQLSVRVNLNFSQDSVNYISKNLQNNLNLVYSLSEGKTFSSINSTKQRKEEISALFDVDHFVISPIMLQNEMRGLIFVGNQSNALPITEGDEEIISIMANQIGQSLENAKLFEQVFTSSQALESKVHERTRQLEDALEKVQNISKTKSEFISAVSHELRTPLTSIKGYASILMAGKLGEIPSQVKDRLGKINLHSDNLVNLINDLLDISRIESGRIEMNIKKYDVIRMIANVHDLLTPQMKDKKINWKVEAGANLPEVAIDSSQFERVFINLISNAIKFTPENGTISVNIKQQENNIMKFEVTDTGIGITEKDVSKLFDEFYRVENKINEHVKGTGLGLSLAKKIVEAHGGTIWVTSVIDQGTTFHFTVPINQPLKKQTILKG